MFLRDAARMAEPFAAPAPGCDRCNGPTARVAANLLACIVCDTVLAA